MHRPGILRTAALWFAAALVFSVTPAVAAGNSAVDPNATHFEPNRVLSFDIPKLSQKIKVDGKLDEAAWATAKKLTNFCEVDPGDNCAPSVNTEAFVAYDDDTSMSAFIVMTNPGAIRATITDRDRICRRLVGVFTPSGPAEWLQACVSPRGIRATSPGNNEDDSFDMVWYSGGQLTATDGPRVCASLPQPSLPQCRHAVMGHPFFHKRRAPRAVVVAPLSRDKKLLLPGRNHERHPGRELGQALRTFALRARKPGERTERRGRHRV
jgi:hypothetical protein